MEALQKAKEWINENVPMLNVLYQNKYVGMGYDRFASLPPSQQKQILLGIIAGFFALVAGFLFFSYISLWSMYGNISESRRMVSLLQQHQRTQKNQSGQVSDLERNNQLAGPGRLKEHLQRQAQAAQISPRLTKIEETPESSGRGDDPRGGDVRLKQATMTLERITLRQLTQLINYIEFGANPLSVSSLKITNDPKLRGYMGVQLTVVVYLFSTEAG